ncbi:MAG TPA: response regulator [Acidimicrobiales bacterium]|nr:response regulator [Acidimicrobiales bacterium]
MAYVVIVSDARSVLDEIRSVLDDGVNEIVELFTGPAVRTTVANDSPDLVIADCQIQNMGGIAICHDLKLEESGGRIPHVPVLLLLDRRADVFLAKRSGAEGYLVKPLDPMRLRRAIDALLDRKTHYDETFMPFTIAAAKAP